MQTSLSRTNLLREVRKRRFEEAYEGWRERRLTQEEAGTLLGMSERNFRRYVLRYEADGLEGLIDRRVEEISRRRAPVDEVMRLVDLYQSQNDGWSASHLHAWYCRGAGTRSYTWLKNTLQATAALPRAKACAKNRRKRGRRPLPGWQPLFPRPGSWWQGRPGAHASVRTGAEKWPRKFERRYKWKL